MENIFERLFYSNHSTSLLASVYRFIIFMIGSLWYEYHSPEFTLFSFKRWAVVLVLSPIIMILMIWNHLGFLLDDIFYPNWESQQVSKPLFIIGNARSGTTWLHRCITSLDTTKYTTFKTWEIIFAPSVIWRMFFHGCYSVDKAFGSPLYWTICAVESRLIGTSQLHAVGLQLAEEDEWLMTHICLAQLMCFFYPCGPAAVCAPLIMFDAQPPSAQPLSLSLKRNIFKYYRQCVQRHLYARAMLHPHSDSTEVVFVSKNPAFTLRLESLYRTFPDCRVVSLLRDPVQSIPSMVSYLSQVH